MLRRHRNVFVAICYLSLFVYIKFPSSQPQQKVQKAKNIKREKKLSKFKTPKLWPSDPENVSSSKEQALQEGLPEAKELPNLPLIDAVLIIKSSGSSIETMDIEQWCEYAWFSGIDKIFAYDSSKNSRLEEFVTRFYPKKLIYQKWDKSSNSNTILDKWEDVSELDHAWANYGNDRKASLTHVVYNNPQQYWLLESDLNDYVFSEVDKKAGFLRRLIHRNWLLFRSCESFLVKKPDFLVDKHGFLVSTFPIF